MSDLGSRIKIAADAVGGLDRLLPFLGDVKRRTLTDYVSGKSEPRVSTVIAIAQATGYRLEWLLTGAGEKREPSMTAMESTPSISPSLMHKLGQLVDMTFREENGRIRDLELVIETGKAYNDLCALVDDLTDADAVEEALPLVKRRLKKRLADTANNPANRKHSA
ncbi:helix-turn-helix domain-containing protein [Brucella sp. 2716]|uniref:helix-turn-helix domain-containing protein n=1 Tax=Brucella sp. 2716 TaxID=2975052 RepID=UPI00217E2DD8|nr:helix-turn-helix transcriptional regulator [Brucella sp. 2716]UWF58468.1 helix-turn-helix domain-containing protein [Brucella sp. 2716]